MGLTIILDQKNLLGEILTQKLKLTFTEFYNLLIAPEVIFTVLGMHKLF